MPLQITPRSSFGIDVGEEEIFTLDMVDHLDGDTVSSHTMTITDSGAVDVTGNFGGDSSEDSGVLTFGVIGYAAGTYTVTFWVTCNEVLPNAVTPREFKVQMKMIVS